MHNKELINIVKKFYNNNNFSIRKTAEIFNISKSTIHRWLHLQNTDKKVFLLNQDKINKYKKIIKDELLNDCFCSAKNIQNIIFNKCSTKISIASIYIYIHQLGFTFKKINKRKYINKNTLKLKQKEFQNKIDKIKYKDIFCIDETYFYDNCNNDYGWTLKNLETIVYNKVNQIKYTVIMIISYSKIIAYEILKNKNVDQYIFSKFLTNKVFPFCKNKYILMDNAKFHKTKAIMHLFNNSTNKILFVPPYSPEFNPIENVFGVIKNKYKNNNLSFVEIIKSFDYDLFYFYENAFGNLKEKNKIFL